MKNFLFAVLFACLLVTMVTAGKKGGKKGGNKGGNNNNNGGGGGSSNDDTCTVRGWGFHKSFANLGFKIRLACKYRAAEFKCGNHLVQVTPGQAFDKRGRYYTDTVWVSVVQEGTDNYWMGRTSALKVNRYFDNPQGRSPWATKESSLPQGSFEIKMQDDGDTRTTTLTSNPGKWTVAFQAYSTSDKQRKKNAGVTISCPHADFTDISNYPDTLCGNDTSRDAVRETKKDQSLVSSTKSVLYNILNMEHVYQTDFMCEKAVNVFERCPKDKSEVIKDCTHLAVNSNAIRCLLDNGINPTAAFAHCLKLKCFDDVHSCDVLTDMLQDCPAGGVLPKGGCPKLGKPKIGNP